MLAASNPDYTSLIFWVHMVDREMWIQSFPWISTCMLLHAHIGMWQNYLGHTFVFFLLRTNSRMCYCWKSENIELWVAECHNAWYGEDYGIMLPAKQPWLLPKKEPLLDCFLILFCSIHIPIITFLISLYKKNRRDLCTWDKGYNTPLEATENYAGHFFPERQDNVKVILTLKEPGDYRKNTPRANKRNNKKGPNNSYLSVYAFSILINLRNKIIHPFL